MYICIYDMIWYVYAVLDHPFSWCEMSVRLVISCLDMDWGFQIDTSTKSEPYAWKCNKRMYLFIYLCMHVCMYVCVCVCVYDTRTHTGTKSGPYGPCRHENVINVYVCVCVCMYVCMIITHTSTKSTAISCVGDLVLVCVLVSYIHRKSRKRSNRTDRQDVLLHLKRQALLCSWLLRVHRIFFYMYANIMIWKSHLWHFLWFTVSSFFRDRILINY